MTRASIERDGANLLIVLGAPRSGTTWIAKILDSHPGVLYRHEPDTVLRAHELPVFIEKEDAERFASPARHYLQAWAKTRTLKSAGPSPTFEKNYRAALLKAVRDLSISGLRVADGVVRMSRLRRLTVPDFVRTDSPVPAIVIKSVSSRGRAAAFLTAMPAAKVIFIVRHPCGQVASFLNGLKTGRFERAVPFSEMLTTGRASRVGLTPDSFSCLPLIEQAAWHWAIVNQKAADDLGGDARALSVSYEAMCYAPHETAKSIFAFAGLRWEVQTDSFLQRSTAAGKTRNYYSLTRDPAAAAEKWRTELSEAERAAILRIAAQVPVGRGYRE